MAKIWLRDIKDHLNQEVWLKGWVFNKRGSKKIQFVELRDGTMVVQGIVTIADSDQETWDICDTLTQESSLEVRAQVVEHPKSVSGCELIIKEIKVIQIAVDFPITKKEHGPDFLLKRRHLWLRSRLQRSIMQVRHEIIASLHNFFYERGFTHMDSPILTGTIGEEGSTLFSTEYFDKGNAYLAQTGQLYLEASCAALGKVYCFGPTFRAEKSKTRRHLTEFWMLEAEVAFNNNEDNMDLQEEMFKHVVQHVIDKCPLQLKTLGQKVENLQKFLQPFARISYDDAVDRLHKKGSKIIRGKDLGAEDEVKLTKDFDMPVFIYNYPKSCKAFYMKKDPTNDERVLCSDLLVPGYGEVIGASQREDDLETLKQGIIDFGLDPAAFDWYLDLRRYGTFEHSGFGIGLERTISVLTGVKHIRETIPFPRMMTHLEP
ncbi:MAG: asparagine--tRNA ligase [Candidatus Cloacimonadota bacterium]|nr:MAG: asparagine--tRNA ligase [Candidatus Cloacimonadota bacterium]